VDCKQLLIAGLFALMLTGSESAFADGEKAPAASIIAPVAPLAGYALAWNDEFTGTALDAAKWDYRTDSKHLSTQKPANVSVKDGLLHLALKKEAAGGKQYTGAGIVSKPTFKYAYYEARIKMPAGAGWHTAFWLMKHDGSGTTDFQAAAQGIDVGDNDSIDHESYKVVLNKYNPEPPANYGFTRLPTPDLSADFHVFGCEFTPESVSFYLDGKLVHVVDARQIPHGEQNLWFSSIASHMGSTPKVDDAALPQETLCDYVRVFTQTNGTTTSGKIQNGMISNTK
jgi:beta-glucanase (GH16 family)